jgi:hypothetical protein
LNLDNAYSLERRVREQHKKKLSLRDDILRVRAERQQIALQMDEIRIKHESESNEAQVCLPTFPIFHLYTWLTLIIEPQRPEYSRP